MSDQTLHRQDDDWVERALREVARSDPVDYIADAGFTARVMDALPRPAAAPAWRKRAVATLWTLAAAGAVAAFPEAFSDAVREGFRLIAQPVSLAQVGAGVLALGAAMWTGAAFLLRED